jgi:adenosylhomocysteine nucleosidase
VKAKRKQERKMLGIIGAMEEELGILKAAMENPETSKTGAFEFHTGALEGKKVVLLRCGIGKVNAAVGCAILISRFNPQAVINTGSAGGIDPSLKFGDAILSTGLLYHDVDLTAFNYRPGQIPGQPAVFPVPDSLVSGAERAVDELKAEGLLPGDFNSVRGLIASGDIFMHDPEKIAEIRRVFPEVRAVEMESAAIAHTCALFQVPGLIIRALSDIAGAESPMTSVEFLPIAAKHSSEIVRRIIRNW